MERDASPFKVVTRLLKTGMAIHRAHAVRRGCDAIKPAVAHSMSLTVARLNNNVMASDIHSLKHDKV